MKPVAHKQRDVPSSLCREGCSQLWENECRAGFHPHSSRERAQRNSGTILCLMHENVNKAVDAAMIVLTAHTRIRKVEMVEGWEETIREMLQEQMVDNLKFYNN